MPTVPIAYFQDIRRLLRQELMAAQHTIQVAVAWFTDQALYELLLQKATEQVSVTVLVRNDVINVNAEGIDWQRLLAVPDATLYFANAAPPLHHKFCLIDGRKVISGSYNWTYAAQRNHENVVVFTQPEVMTAFQQAYGKLLDSAREITSLPQALAERPPAHDQALAQEAARESELRDYAQAQDQADTAYEQLVVAANAAYYQQDYTLAETSLRQALARKPTGAEGYGLLAQVYWRTGQFAAAVAATQQAEVNGLISASLWNVRGLALSGQQNYREALVCYDRSIAAEPGVADWYHNRFLALLDSRQDRLGDTARLATIRVASDEIKKYQDGSQDFQLLRAYIVRAALRDDLPEARQDARAARQVFNRLPTAEQDLHDLDDLQAIDNSLR